MGVVLLFAKYVFYVIIILVLYTISTISLVLFTYYVSTSREGLRHVVITRMVLVRID